MGEELGRRTCTEITPWIVLYDINKLVCNQYEKKLTQDISVPEFGQMEVRTVTEDRRQGL